MRRAFLEKDGSKMEKARLMTDPRVGSGALFGERRLETTSEQKDEYSEVTTGNSSSRSRKQGSKILSERRDADE